MANTIHSEYVIEISADMCGGHDIFNGDGLLLIRLFWLIVAN